MENKIVLFEDDEIKIDVEVINENIWLTQKQIAELYKKDQSVISRHINNIFKSGEIDKKSNMQKMHNANSDKSVEVKACNFLYVLVKNHPFVDGNKRIAATLFIYFLNHYSLLYKDGIQTIDNNTLTAVTFLIAESNPKEKQIIIDLVMNFLN